MKENMFKNKYLLNNMLFRRGFQHFAKWNNDFLTNLYTYVSYYWNGYKGMKGKQRSEFKSWTMLIAFSANAVGKGRNPSVLPPAIGK